MSAGDYWTGVSQGIIGNLLTIPILVLGAIVWIKVWFGQLKHFFGIGRDRRLIIFTSTLQIPTGGSVGSDGLPRSYSGPAMPINEAILTGRLLALFERPVPDLAGVGNPLNRLFLRPHQAEQSNSFGQGVPDSTTTSFITLGSPGYNDVSKAVQVSGRNLAGFSNTGDSMQFSDGTTESNPRRGFVYRFTMPGSGQVGFYVAGLSTLGTTVACNFLIDRWRELRKVTKDNQDTCWIVESLDDQAQRAQLVKVLN